MMIITFCGHADFQETEEYKREMLNFLEETVGDQPAQMYLGGYGRFDRFSYACCKAYQKTHPNVSLVYVSPYLNECHLQHPQTCYDAVIYPPIENKPLKFAIVYRNKYMVEQADCVVACISRTFGGAYQTYQHAKKKGKPILNLAVFEG